MRVMGRAIEDGSGVRRGGEPRSCTLHLLPGHRAQGA